jgi:uncharacterized protein (DUF2249 family)/hemerythrin-like domain-containing protein
MTITQTEAFDAMLEHHRTLDEHVGIRITALVGAAEGGIAYEPAVAALVAYLAEEVLPHALAEEHTIYRVAGGRSDLADTVNEMTAEHRVLTSATESLANAATAPAALEQATQIGALFTTHVNKENDLLLPVLLEDDDVDLAQLLVQMHRLTEAAHDAPFVEDASSPDSEAVVVSLLVEAANELANAGHGDRACQLVASAWAALRTPRPALAARTTASLHRLVSLVTREPVAFRTPEEGSGAAADRQLDVRHLPPAQRHETIFAAYHGLAPETGYVLVNDHDPKPLRYQFEAEHAGEFTWDTIESGPEVWRVRIGRPALDSATAGGSYDCEGPGHQELDVRVLAHGKRHDVIFATYDDLVAGSGFVIVNDHDPRPLRYQFEAEHAGEFTWDYLESGPEVWRVRIGRPLIRAAG